MTTTTATGASAAGTAGAPGRAPAGRNYAFRRGFWRWRFARYVTVIIICAVMAFPVYWMLVTALTPESDLVAGVAGFFPRHFDIQNFVKAWNAQPWARWFWNTIFVGVVSVLLTVSTNVLAGYAFAKLHFPGKNFIFLALVATMMVPIQVTMVPTFQITVDLHMFNSLWGVIIPGVATSFGIFLARQFMLSVPDELLEAARVDGAGHLRTFVKVYCRCASR